MDFVLCNFLMLKKESTQINNLKTVLIHYISLFTPMWHAVKCYFSLNVRLVEILMHSQFNFYSKIGLSIYLLSENTVMILHTLLRLSSLLHNIQLRFFWSSLLVWVYCAAIFNVFTSTNSYISVKRTKIFFYGFCALIDYYLLLFHIYKQ